MIGLFSLQTIADLYFSKPSRFVNRYFRVLSAVGGNEWYQPQIVFLQIKRFTIDRDSCFQLFVETTLIHILGSRIMSTDHIQGSSSTKIIEAMSKLRDVAISLGKYNLDYLLQLCSFLSIMSFLNFKNKTVSLQLWSFFNPNFIKNLSKAILLSNSNTTKQRYFEISEFISVFNRLKEIDSLIYNEDEPGTYSGLDF